MSNRYPFALLACSLVLAAGNSLPVRAMTEDTETEHVVVSAQEPENRTLKGTVVDENNEALIGAVVKIKGTTNVVLCDLDGKFTITDVPPGAVLAVSYISYEPQEIPVNGRTTFKIKMQPAAKNFQEVVVTAMGILRKEKSLTYATQQIKSDEFMKVQEVNIANSLQGKVAGITITPSAGGAGGASKIQLRGAKSILGSSSPLIVVDGVPMSNESADRFPTRSPSPKQEPPRELTLCR